MMFKRMKPLSWIVVGQKSETKCDVKRGLKDDWWNKVENLRMGNAGQYSQHVNDGGDDDMEWHSVLLHFNNAE